MFELAYSTNYDDAADDADDDDNDAVHFQYSEFLGSFSTSHPKLSTMLSSGSAQRKLAWPCEAPLTNWLAMCARGRLKRNAYTHHFVRYLDLNPSTSVSKLPTQKNNRSVHIEQRKCAYFDLKRAIEVKR